MSIFLFGLVYCRKRCLGPGTARPDTFFAMVLLGQRDAAATAERRLKYNPRDAQRKASVSVVSRHELRDCLHWQYAFASQHKDHRYYNLIDETIHPEFKYLYFVLRDSQGRITAIQPFFIVEQDILTGVRPYVGRAVDVVRKLWPRFMFMKSMMVGCVAGEAHLDDGSDIERAANAALLAHVIEEYARELATPLIVLKEFPASYREILSCFERRGFTRIHRVCRSRASALHIQALTNTRS